MDAITLERLHEILGPLLSDSSYLLSFTAIPIFYFLSLYAVREYVGVSALKDFSVPLFVGSGLGITLHYSSFILGPMAKQHRMALMSLGIIGSMVEVYRSGHFEHSLTLALYLIAIGAVFTCLRRIAAILKHFGA